MRSSSTRVAALLGVIALMALGCEPEDTLVTANEAEAEDNLALFEEQGPTSYVYTIQRVCECDFSGEWVRVVVEDGEVASALLADGEAGNGATMPHILEDVLAWTKRDPLEFDASYEPELGYLLHLELDLSPADDDSFELRVDCFAEGTADDICPLEAP